MLGEGQVIRINCTMYVPSMYASQVRDISKPIFSDE